MNTLFFIILIIMIIRTFHYMRTYNATLLHSLNRLYIRHLYMRIAYSLQEIPNDDKSKIKVWYLLIGCEPNEGYDGNPWKNKAKKIQIVKYKV